VIPGSATARIAMRLVTENDPSKMIDRVVEHIRKQGYFITESDPDIATLAAHPLIAKVTYRKGGEAGGGAWRTDPASAAGHFVHDALVATWGNQVVEVRTLGGGVPARPFIDKLHLPVIGISLANYDDNQHTDNENMQLGNLWDGAETIAGILLH
jgi:acetylornithine deacetylase/succinyl-diaminopimelate desuccinylase-like protein